MPWNTIVPENAPSASVGGNRPIWDSFDHEPWSHDHSKATAWFGIPAPFPVRRPETVTDVSACEGFGIVVRVRDVATGPGGGSANTTTGFDFTADAPAESVVVTPTVYVFGVVYTRVAGFPFPVAPSPKFHANVYGPVPEFGVAMNVTVCVIAGCAGA